MNHCSRIDLSSTATDAITKMCDGNIGALNVLISLFKEEAAIDPDSAFPGWGTVLSLDNAGIYGSSIWVLYKYVCGCSILNMVALFRASQLGFISEETIVRTASGIQNGEATPPIDIPGLLAQVRERLPEFGKSTTTSPEAKT